MSFNPQQPYDDLPSLPPRSDVETKAVLKQCVAASRALADPSTKEVLRYRTALRNGYEALASQPFSIELVRETCRILRGHTVDFRSPSDHVRISDTRTRSVIYTPPSGGPELVEKLRNLESYLLAADGPDPLIRMAVAHYQFEAIHPFTDGNGRTGRILNILYLVHMGLLQIPVLYISRFIIQNKPDYYRLPRQRDDLQTPGPVGGASKMISTATDPGQHSTSTCPKTAAFYPCPQNMSIAWTYRTPWAIFSREFGQVCRQGRRCGFLNLRISPLKRLEARNKSKNPACTPVPLPLRGRYSFDSKPGGPLSQDTHTSPGLSICGLGVST